MTHTIRAESTKSDRAQRFATELTRAMARRGVGTRPIAEAMGSSRTTIMYWRTGRILPRIETADRLAAALDAPILSTLARDLRRKSCSIDGVEFVDDSGSDNRVYCSASCQTVAEKRRKGVTTDKRAAVAERRLLAHQRAVAAFCAACEPDGRCVNAECPLRSISPLPLFDSHIDIAPARAKPHNGIREPGADSARMSRVWAGYTPAQRAERTRRAAASRKARGIESLSGEAA